MKKLSLILLALVLGGCVDLSNPEATVKSLGYTIHKNKYSKYRDILMGEAKANFGSREVFEELRKEADVYKNAKVGKKVLVKADTKRRFEERYVYQVPVDFGSGAIAEVTVKCVRNYGYDAIWPEDVMASQAKLHNQGYPPPPPHPYPYPEPPRGPQMQWWTSCQISAIQGLDF